LKIKGLKGLFLKEKTVSSDRLKRVAIKNIKVGLTRLIGTNLLIPADLFLNPNAI